MSTTNSVFIDSSILIENNKGTKTKLLAGLLNETSLRCFISETVISEFIFHFLKLNGKAAPLTLKEGGKIPSIFSISDDYRLINLFHFLAGDAKLISMVPAMMAKYNLLPNDAIILATCKLHGITQLASHDSDFINPCKAEGIELLTEE